MSRTKTQIGQITYNPADESFEALVTFHGETGTRRVPASFRAPLTAEFDTVSRGLLIAAKARLNRPGQMKSRIEKAPAQAPIPGGFDWQGLLHGGRAA